MIVKITQVQEFPNMGLLREVKNDAESFEGSDGKTDKKVTIKVSIEDEEEKSESVPAKPKRQLLCE